MLKSAKANTSHCPVDIFGNFRVCDVCCDQNGTDIVFDGHPRVQGETLKNQCHARIDAGKR